MRKLLSLSMLSSVLLLAACGGGQADTSKQQAVVRSTQVKLLKALQKNDSRAYCALTFNPNQNDKLWQAACIKRKRSVNAKQIKQDLAAVAAANVVIQGSQGTISLPSLGPQQFQLVGGRWLLNTAPNVSQNIATAQKTNVRDRTRFYLATLINKDAPAYCVVGIKQGEKTKACITRARAWFSDKNGDYKARVALAKQQLKNINTAKVSVDGSKATVETDPEAIQLTNTGQGNNWIVAN